MKKIGVITFHRAINYGAVLQAFALKTFLQEAGNRVEIIDYRNAYIEKAYSSKKLFEERGVKEIIRHVLYSHNIKKKNRAFDSFRTNYLNINKNKVYYRDTISSSVSDYDALITGSDQVWNPEAHSFDMTYYLDFVEDNNKKYSYAASFGGDTIVNKYLSEIRDLLSAFSVCSVREYQSAMILNSQFGIDARVDVDPVFLLKANQWRGLFGIVETKTKYAVIYTLTFTELQKNIAIDLHNKGFEIVMIGKPVRNPFPFKCSFYPSLSPVEFVELISNSSFVITNSFHGTAFSIIFNVPMAIELYGGSNSKVNERLTSVASLFGLNDRIIKDINEFYEMNSIIDWNKVNDLVDVERCKSIDYIHKGILKDG